MPDFNFSDFHVSEAEVKRVLASPEGMQLLQLLNQDGGKRLRQAAEALKNGRQSDAQQIISPLMESREAAQLLKKLERK